MIKIEIWSDVVCPFCYIGKRKLEEALDKFPQKEQVEIEFKSYEIGPDAPLYSGQDFYKSMVDKFGGMEKTKQVMTDITEQAKEVGLEFHFATMKPTNTFDAHRLTKFAKEYGKEYDIMEKLFFANFTESIDVGNIEKLAEIAAEVGLSKEEALQVLQDKQAFAKDVTSDIKEAKQLEFSSVPNFVINRKYVISGAQSTETFIKALDKAFEDEKRTTFESLTLDDETSVT